MKKHLIVICLLLVVICVYGVDYRLGEPVYHNNIIVWPVLIDIKGPSQAYISLDEGIISGTVTVAEFGTLKPDEALETTPPSPAAEEVPQSIRLPQLPLNPSAEWMYQNQTDLVYQYSLNQNQLVQQMEQGYGTGALVNELHIQNNSDQWLFLMAGEIITGGKQNRVVKQDVLIPPHSEPLSLQVFCVEQGRWQPNRENENPEYFTSGKGLVTQNSLRKTIVAEGEQSRVWAKVDELNTAQGSANETSDYTKNLDDEQRLKEIQTYLDAVLKKMAGEAVVSGVVVAINGEIYGADILNSEKLFTALKEKILTSYFIEAVVGKPDKPIEINRGAINGEALAFLQTVTTRQGEERLDMETGYRNVAVQVGEINGSYLLVGSGSETFRLHQVFFAK
ncbi:MAG: DUF6569 family protein [Spirochaetota bacterium]